MVATNDPSSNLAPTRPLNFERMAADTMAARADELYTCLNRRRSVRFFSDEPIPLDVVRKAIHTAGTAPSGAHKQPWTFALVTDPVSYTHLTLPTICSV